jgi:hypothetical protein
MIWINVLLALFSIPALVLGCVRLAEGKLWGGLIAFVAAIVMAFNVASIIEREQSEIPTALDVYRGKTTLEITYRDSVAVDSVVVYKMK